MDEILLKLGSKTAKRKDVLSVPHSVILYGAPAWGEALGYIKGN